MTKRRLPSELRAEQDVSDAELGAALRHALTQVNPRQHALVLYCRGDGQWLSGIVPLPEAIRLTDSSRVFDKALYDAGCRVPISIGIKESP